jgi:hypothetical protein
LGETDIEDWKEYLFEGRNKVSVMLGQQPGALKHVFSSLVQPVATGSVGEPSLVGLFPVLLVEYDYVFAEPIKHVDIYAHLASSVEIVVNQRHWTYFVTWQGLRKMHGTIALLYQGRAVSQSCDHASLTVQNCYDVHAGESLANIIFGAKPMPAIAAA